MWINPCASKKELFYLLKFESMEEDFLPYIRHLRSISLRIKEKENRLSFLNLVDKIYERCDDEYLKQNEDYILSYLYADEMAEFTVHLSYLLLEIKEE